MNLIDSIFSSRELADIRISLTTFSDNPRTYHYFSDPQSPATIKGKIANFVYTGGNTNTARALDEISNNIFRFPEDRPGVPNLVVVLTDGVATVEEGRVPEALSRLLQETNIVGLALGQLDDFSFSQIVRDSRFRRRVREFETLTNFVGPLTAIITSALCPGN